MQHRPPKVCAAMLQPCTIVTSERWRDMLAGMVQSVVTIGGCFCAMDIATHSVELAFLGITQPLWMSRTSAAYVAHNCPVYATGSLQIGVSYLRGLF